MTLYSNKNGFTLIELLVSVALFSVVMVISLGALLSLTVASRKAQAFKTGIDNLSSAVESITRSLRTGYDYHCGLATGGDCTNGDSRNTIVFTSDSGGNPVYYKFFKNGDSNAETVCGQTAPNVGCIARATNVGGTAWLSITAPEVVLQDIGFTFYVAGTLVGSADNRQPRVIISLKGYVQVSSTQQMTFNIQSTVTQRVYDQ